MSETKNGYIMFYNQKRLEVYADTLYQAIELAQKHFNPPKSKRHMVHGMLAEKNGKQVIHLISLHYTCEGKHKMTSYNCKHTDRLIVDERTIQGKQVIVSIDENPESPRDWDNLGTILYTSHKYVLGDKRVDCEVIQEIVNDLSNVVIPVYAYIHSGIKLSTESFNDRWDSGQCGIIYCSREKAISEFGTLWYTQTMKCFKGEIELFSQYLNGDIYTVSVGDESISGVYAGTEGEIINELLANCA